MADEPTKEVKWSCGCHVVDGELVQECTQVAASGEISAERHGQLKPYAAKCARKAALNVAENFTAEPVVEVPNPSQGTGPSGTFTVTDVSVSKEGNVVTLSSSPQIESNHSE